MNGPLPVRSGPRTRIALLTVAACHTLAVAIFLAWYTQQSSALPQNCSGLCTSPRDGVGILAGAIGAPALLGSVLVSSLMTAALQARTRSCAGAIVTGTACAAAGLILAGSASSAVLAYISHSGR